MIAWIRRILGIEDINTRLDHVANRVTRLEVDTNEVERYVFPQKHRK